MSLQRFLDAQVSDVAGHTTALQELKAGRKTSHWIWYIFPQLAELGRSSTAKFYGLQDVAEAHDYLREPTLRKNLLALLNVVHEQLRNGISLIDLMGGTTDSLKLMSCVTLFERVAADLTQLDSEREFGGVAQRCSEIMGLAEQQGYARCKVTLKATE